MAILTEDQVVSELVARGVPPHVAQGVAMNFRDESGFNTGIHEQSGGGFGLAQWTGPRRAALEQFAAARGTTPDDPGAQLDFFMAENSGPESAAWQQVLAAPTAQDAAVAFVNKWERPAPEHAASRSAKYSGGTYSSAAATGQAPNLGPNPYEDPEIDTTRRFQSRMADDLSRSVGRRGAGGGQQRVSAFDSETASLQPVALDFASATPAPAPPQPRPAARGQPQGGLAELFKVKDIGGAAQVDPVTGQPALLRTRRV